LACEIWVAEHAAAHCRSAALTIIFACGLQHDEEDTTSPLLKSGQCGVRSRAGDLALPIDGIDFSRVRWPPRRLRPALPENKAIEIQIDLCSTVADGCFAPGRHRL
jgi:hypothetical protein